MFIETPDGHRIRLLVSAPEDGSYEAMCVMLHGLFNNSGERILELIGKKLASRRVASVRFDMRGHGDSGVSSKKFFPTSGLVDVHSVMKWARRNCDGRIDVVASSFGGSLALLYAGLDLTPTFERVVLLNPVVSYKRTFFGEELAWGPGLFNSEVVNAIRTHGSAQIVPHFVGSAPFLSELLLLEPEAHAASLKGRALAIHGDEDDKVPASATEDVLGEFADVRIVERAGHGFKDSGVEASVVEQACEFLSS